MNIRCIHSIVLAAALVGCGSSSSDSPKDEPGPSDSKPSAKPSDPGKGTDDAKPDETDTNASMAGSSAEDSSMTADQAGADAPAPADEDPGMTEEMPANGEFPDIRGVGCKIDSGFPGDELCLAPPKEGEGMQLHVGPTNYDDPADVDRFVFEPGAEASACWTVRTPNDVEIYYQGSVLSGRAGTHHIINTGMKPESGLTEGGFTTVCEGGGTFGGTNANSLGALPGASKAYMARRPIAPENAGLGRPIPAHSFMQADMHYFNFTDKPIMREFWLNLYFIPKEQVTETPNQIRCMGGFGYRIAPGTDMVYKYETAPLTAGGRITELLGHYHAHGKRFTAFIKRASGETEKVFEMYDYLDPLIFDYNTVAKNPEFSDSSGGAVSGMLEVQAGDVIQWECHIVNDSMETLTYVNEVKTGEMCNLWGASVGTTIQGYAQ